MLLLTIQEWLGPGRNMTDAQREKTVEKIQLVGFVTRLSLPEAIKHIYKYKQAYNQKFLLGLTLKVISVSKIDDLPDDVIDMAGMELVEEKPISPTEFS